MEERRYRGRSASTGIAIGPLATADTEQSSKTQTQGEPAEEETALREAMVKAGADLETLAEVASGDGADILAFQIEMLTDPALIEDVLVAIGGGRDALEAWKAGLSEQIQDYETADDDYFRARASDLADLRDRVGRALMGIAEVIPEIADGAILLDRDLTPSRFLALDLEKLGGIALLGGSISSHVAMLARARGLPMAIAIGEAVEDTVGSDIEVILDGEQGLLVIAPTATTRRGYTDRLAKLHRLTREAASTRLRPAVTRDGQAIDVLINVDDPNAIDDDTLKASDGVGLLRTEFLFLGRSDLPGEDEQYQTYAGLVDRLAGRPAIVRTLDIGGDKPLPGISKAEESNPFLGLRGIRLCLEQEALFKVQIRALLRAATGRSLKVMLPMVSVQAEIDRTKVMFETCLAELRAEGVAAEMPPIGIMVETPVAAIAIDRLDAAFYSIGSNDLIQYVMAAARDASGPVAALLDPTHPAIVRLMERVVAHGNAAGKEVSLCGDMGSEPSLLRLLLRTGLRKVSIAPAALDRIKAEIAKIDLSAPSTAQP